MLRPGCVAPSVVSSVLTMMFLAGPASLATAPPQDSEKSEKVRTLVQQAAAAEEMEKLDEAESLLRAALDVDSSDPVAVTALGRFLYSHEQGAEGLALLYRALELDPKGGEPTIALVDALLSERAAYYDEGDGSNADAQLSRAREALERTRKAGAPDSPALQLRRVRVLSLDEATAKEAFETAQKLVAADAESQEAHSALVDAATAADAFDDAIAFYDQTEMTPWIKAWFTAAVKAARATRNFNHFENDEAAVQDYLAADALVLESARLKPDLFDAASERASFYRSWAGWVRYTRQQRTDEAWDLFTSACGRDPTNNNAVEGLSWVGARLYEAGDLDKARELYRQACMVAPERADFWNNYGLICRDTGHFEESFRAYRRGMALAPDDPRIINDTALILLYHLHRDLDLAEKWFIRGEDLSRARLEQAKADEDDGVIAEQRGVLGDCLCNLARLYSDEGRMQEAAENWNELRDVDSTRPELPENGGEQPPSTPAAPPPEQTPPSK